jgi:hypothetical protein
MQIGLLQAAHYAEKSSEFAVAAKNWQHGSKQDFLTRTANTFSLR